MVEDIRNCETWAEAERWLAKHGYGITQIEQQKEAWDTAHTKPKTAAKPVASKVTDQITDAVTKAK